MTDPPPDPGPVALVLVYGGVTLPLLVALLNVVMEHHPGAVVGAALNDYGEPEGLIVQLPAQEVDR